MYLNILFILSCIPIITIFPAIAALFGVVRKWRITKEAEVFTQYKEMFVENWKQSYLVGILYTIIGLLLMVDILFLQEMTIPYKGFIHAVILLVSFLFVLSFFSIYPLMVNMITSFKHLCLNSLKVGLYKIHLSIFCMIIISAWTILSLRFSFLIFFFFFSVSAYLIYWFADLKFKHLMPQNESENRLNNTPS
ncbi:YesL family protein [Bacillus sp. EB106-08-02-XG196]|uniref:YesL family protein n=1 Tax=Bacillus sp. EB106-08-02-XG196 TaxID=2737049 RepID=UPI0015C4A358|nr:YesL family protein [Bacillus sp. EB106-08-02-XG196]NWQ40726.1 YesL family protein [Bacillus sp. EB106-08-02-XG196]